MELKCKILLVLLCHLIAGHRTRAWTGDGGESLQEPAAGNEVGPVDGGHPEAGSRESESAAQSQSQGQGGEDDEESTVLQRVFQELAANPRHNFVAAPVELEKLLLSHLRGEGDEMPNEIEDETEDGNRLEDTPSPIRVWLEQERPRRGNSTRQVQRVEPRSRWAFNFQKRDTHKHLFYDTPHTHVYADSMGKDDIFRFAFLEELNATALELPLQASRVGTGTGPGPVTGAKDLRLLLVLPDAMDGLAALERQLATDWRSLERLRRRLRPTLVRVFMPKFRMVHRLPLARLVGTESPLAARLAGVWQEAQIQVSEDGLGELKRQTVLFWNAYSSLRTTPQRFDMNHPFLFALLDAQGLQLVGHLAKL